MNTNENSPKSLAQNVEQLEKLLEGVRPAPWQFTGERFSIDIVDSNGYSLIRESNDHDSCSFVDLTTSESEFIALARNVLPELIAEYKKLKNKSCE